MGREIRKAELLMGVGVSREKVGNEEELLREFSVSTDCYSKANRGKTKYRYLGDLGHAAGKWLRQHRGSCICCYRA